jgi:hypothetical protein
MTICKNIVKGRVVYPDYITDIAVREVIFGLLTKYVVARCRVVCVCLMSMSVSYARVVVTRNVATRLGCSKNGVNDIKAQKWFNGASPLLSFSLLCSALLFCNACCIRVPGVALLPLRLTPRTCVLLSCLVSTSPYLRVLPSPILCTRLPCRLSCPLILP